MTVTLLQGDCRELLRALRPNSVHCVVTSPPYWGLRDYGVAGQLGLEPTFQEHIAAMVDVFREVWRVLRKDGTLWINYGDCYATWRNGRSAADTKAAGKDDRTFRDKPFDTVGGVLKPKDLAMIPNRLAIALQEAGWWVRSEIVWGKPNAMPDSARDRPATAHEKVWMLTRSTRYFYDRGAVRQDRLTDNGAGILGWDSGPGAHDAATHARNGRPNSHRLAKLGAYPGLPTEQGLGERLARGRSTRGRHTLGEAIPEADRRPARDPGHAGQINHTKLDRTGRGEGRNLRNYEPAPPLMVWEIATRASPVPHYATFPPELAERCIRAGCPLGGTVLDPFAGTGTAGLVANRLGRNAILMELSEHYLQMADDLLRTDLAKVEGEPIAPRPLPGPLFEVPA